MPDFTQKPDERFVEELLDSSLARYAQAEARPGLEGRVMAGLRAQPEPRGIAWRWVPLAAAAVFLFAAGLYLFRGDEAHVPEVAQQPKPAAPAPMAPAPTVPAIPSAPHVQRPVRTPRPAVEIASQRREPFFRPTPISEQEAALLRFVRQAPPEEVKQVARAERAQPIKELRVEALDIPPVVVGETDSQ